MPDRHRRWSVEDSRWYYPGEPGYADATEIEDLPISVVFTAPEPEPLTFPVRVGDKTFRCPMDDDGYITVPLEANPPVNMSGADIGAHSVAVVKGTFNFIDLLEQHGITPAEAQKALTKYKKEYRAGTSSDGATTDNSGEPGEETR